MDKQEIQSQIDDFRTKIDGLKVKGHLLKLEYQDKQEETINKIESAYAEAKQKFGAMKNAGEAEAGKLGEGFNAAWSAFKSTYHGATEA